MKTATVVFAFASFGASYSSLFFAAPTTGDLALAGGMFITDGHAKLECGQCHIALPDTGSTTSANLKDSEAELCAGCHRGAVEASHPSEFCPARPLPTAFPLDREGRMTCGTCHAFHGETPGLLRTARFGQEFCLSCHELAFFDAMPDKGESLMMSGHLDASSRPWHDVDPYSIRCMTCHDDRIPGRPQVAAVGFSDIAARDTVGGAEHPIGRAYDVAMRSREYQPRNHLADEILLPNGRVGCVSCHVPYSREHGRKPHTRAGLCVECHVM